VTNITSKYLGLLLIGTVVIGACSSSKSTSTSSTVAANASSTSVVATAPSTSATGTNAALVKDACTKYDALIDYGNAHQGDTSPLTQLSVVKTEVHRAAAKNGKWSTLAQHVDAFYADGQAALAAQQKNDVQAEYGLIAKIVSDGALVDADCTPITGSSHPVQTNSGSSGSTTTTLKGP
jgi:hypothetical protein